MADFSNPKTWEDPRWKRERAAHDEVPGSAQDTGVSLSVEFLERITDLAEEMREDLKTAATFEGAWTLTSTDIAIAAINAYGNHTDYILPPLPAQTSIEGADYLLVSREEDRFYFEHCIHVALGHQSLAPEDVPALRAQGELAAEEENFREYLDVLQGAARTIKGDIETFFSRATELVALVELEAMKAGHSFGNFAPALSIAKGEPGRLEIHILGDSEHPSFLDLEPGMRVVIPGAGFNAIQDFPAMKAAEGIEFLLNDNDPFVAGVLHRVAELDGVTNISIQTCTMDQIQVDDGKTGFVLLSNLHPASRDSLIGCMKAVAPSIERGCKALAYHPAQSSDAESSTAQDLLDAMRISGFRVVSNDTAPVLDLTLIPGGTHEGCLAMSGTELVEIMRSAPETGHPGGNAHIILGQKT